MSTIPSTQQEAVVATGEPYLSVVAVSRNDDHGGDLHTRTSLFVSSLIEHARRLEVPIELVLVEWNPPAGRPRLADAIDWPEPTPFCPVRIITVPHDVHVTLPHADGLPLFQMIGKNAGIRRSRGEFVLATNIDIILGAGIARGIAERRLEHGACYRVDRHDVDPVLSPDWPLDRLLDECAQHVRRICRREAHVDVRTGERFRIYYPDYGLPWQAAAAINVVRLVWDRGLALVRQRLAERAARPAAADPADPGRAAQPSAGAALARAAAAARALAVELGDWYRRQQDVVRLHTNASGDFTLLARDDWHRLQGYAELPMYSMHMDGLLLYQAHWGGLREVVLPDPVYHIDHGGGFQPSRTAIRALASSLDGRGVPKLTMADYHAYLREMRLAAGPIEFAGEAWGLNGLELDETDPYAPRG